MPTPKKKADQESFEELIAANITTITNTLSKTNENIDQLARKVTSMACHIVALEALLSEVVAVTGVDLVRVNGRIRTSIAGQAVDQTDSDVVVDLAAAIASPLPRQ